LVPPAAAVLLAPHPSLCAVHLPALLVQASLAMGCSNSTEADPQQNAPRDNQTANGSSEGATTATAATEAAAATASELARCDCDGQGLDGRDQVRIRVTLYVRCAVLHCVASVCSSSDAASVLVRSLRMRLVVVVSVAQ